MLFGEHFTHDVLHVWTHPTWRTAFGLWRRALWWACWQTLWLEVWGEAWGRGPGRGPKMLMTMTTTMMMVIMMKAPWGCWPHVRACAASAVQPAPGAGLQHVSHHKMKSYEKMTPCPSTILIAFLSKNTPQKNKKINKKEYIRLFNIALFLHHKTAFMKCFAFFN